MKAEPCKHEFICVETATLPGPSPAFANLVLTARCRQCLAKIPIGAVDILNGVIYATADRKNAEPTR